MGVPKALIEMLAAHISSLSTTDREDYVFQDSRGGPLRANNFRNRIWLPALKEAGLEGVTFHSLRHSAAGLMIQAGAHMETRPCQCRQSSDPRGT
jgi:integrase